MIDDDTLRLVTETTRANADLGKLRACFPDLHFSECSDDDVSPRFRQVAETKLHALYYITGASGHCLEMTNDAALATGILVAAKVDAD